MKLADIAEIKIGYNYRRETTLHDIKQTVDIPIIQPKDVKYIKIADIESFDKISLADTKDKYFLTANEVLFSNKGEFKAFVWCGKEKTMASSAFYRIKLFNNQYLPEYVAIYLNSPLGRAQLNLRQNTERISTITISDIKQIDIPLIPLEKQKQVASLFLLYEKEVDIMEKIKQNRKKLINSILNQTIKE